MKIKYDIISADPDHNLLAIRFKGQLYFFDKCKRFARRIKKSGETVYYEKLSKVAIKVWEDYFNNKKHDIFS